MTDNVRIVEVGPRDGLQNQPQIIPATEKIQLIDKLSQCGFQQIEAASFVSPKWVPQMADAAEVMAGITRKKDLAYTALTPNMRGFEAALEAKVDAVAVFGAASESFSHKNINCSIAESLERFKPIITAALAVNMPVRGYVSCVIGCPYEGKVKPSAVAQIAEALLKLGCHEISLGDTIGVGTAPMVQEMLQAVKAVVPVTQLAGHFHDTDAQAIRNIETSLEQDIRIFDASIAGLGGCPYAPGAKGNVDTVEVVTRLHALGLSTGLEPEALEEAAAFAQTLKEKAQCPNINRS